MPEQLVDGAIRCSGGDGEADARSDRYGNVFDHNLGAEGLENAIRGSLRLLDGTFDVNREFITPEARNGSHLAHRSGEAPRDPDKEFVASGMAQRVVDQFEVVEIEAQYCDRRGVGTSSGQGLVQSMEEVGAIGQPGQAVVKRFPR